MSARIRRWFEERSLPLPWFATGSEPPGDWRAVLEGESAQAILDRLVESDPFDFGAMAYLVVSDEALLLHPDRLALRSCALVAFRAAMGDEIEPSLVLWLRGLTELAARDLREEDVEAERRRVPLSPEELRSFGQLVPPESGFEPQLARAVTIAFNRLPLGRRVPFCLCMLEGQPLERVAASRNESVAEVEASIEFVLRELTRQADNVRRKRRKRR